jgi:hypothetical protein
MTSRLRRQLCAAPLLLAAGGVMVFTATPTGTAEAQATVLASAGRTELGAGWIHIPLTAQRSIAESLQSLAPGQRVYLVLRDLRADAQPGVVFNLYLGVPASAAPLGPDDSRYVGTLNFLAAAPPASSGRQVSYEVTGQVAALRERKESLATIDVTVAAEGTPALGSHPTIGRMEILAQ